LLFLLPSVPEPLDTGAKIRNRGLLTVLGRDHEVDAIAFGAADSQDALGRLTRRSAVLPPPAGRTTVRRAIDLARSDLPDMGLRLWSPEFMRTVSCFLRERAYEAVQAEGIEMGHYLGTVPSDRRVYDAHNAEFLLQRRLATSGSVLQRLYSRLQWRRLERFERQLVRGSRLTLAVSNHEANQLLALSAMRANVRVVPNAIDVGAYTVRALDAEVGPNLLFVGKLDFRPNAFGIRWFIANVLSQLSDVRLFAVGAAPPRWLIAAGQHDSRVVVTGYVSDDRPYLKRSLALVLPVRSGGGSRLKALIAMASGVPIVSTRFGMEGIEAEPGRHFLMAESPTEWVTAVRRVVNDSRLRQQLACNGRALVEERYDWSAIRADVRAAYAFLS
jgi:glycosyltransferase involved in cell wall biosynthesis